MYQRVLILWQYYFKYHLHWYLTICIMYISFFFLTENTGKLQVHHIHVPDPFILGSSSDLHCNYSWTHPEQESRPIYSIKWYKENAEFFRWVRIENWQWHLHTNSDEIALEHFFLSQKELFRVQKLFMAFFATLQCKYLSHCSRITHYPSFISQDFCYFSLFIHNGDNLNM